VSEETNALIAHRLERARETLDEARLLLNAGHANATVNRLYYACFYAVSALLLADGISTSRHAHLRSVLHRDYVRSGLIPQESGKHFDLLFDSRQESDYADWVVFETDDIRSWMERTELFVRHVAELTEKRKQ